MRTKPNVNLSLMMNERCHGVFLFAHFFLWLFSLLSRLVLVNVLSLSPYVLCCANG